MSPALVRPENGPLLPVQQPESKSSWPGRSQSQGELGLNECQQVEGSVVDGHVADRNSQTNATLGRLDVAEVEHLVVQAGNLFDLLPSLHRSG